MPHPIGKCPAYLSLPISARLLMGSYCICQSWRRWCPGPASSLAETAEFRSQESNPWITLLLFSSCLYSSPGWDPSPRSNHDIPLERKGIWSFLTYWWERIVLRFWAWNSSRQRIPLMSKAGLLEGREQMNTLCFTPPSHSLVCSCITLVTQLLLQMKAVPAPRMDLDTSNFFKIHKKLNQQS